MVINIKSIKRTGGSFLVCVIELIKPCKNKPENETFKGSTVHNYIHTTYKISKKEKIKMV